MREGTSGVGVGGAGTVAGAIECLGSRSPGCATPSDIASGYRKINGAALLLPPLNRPRTRAGQVVLSDPGGRALRPRSVEEARRSSSRRDSGRMPRYPPTPHRDVVTLASNPGGNY